MDNKENKPCPDLASLTEVGYRAMLQMLKDTVADLKSTHEEGDQAVENAINALNCIIDKKGDQEVLLAFLGEMSSGKTSLINAALGYPLFPVAKVTTSACPAEIRYGEKFKLQVFSVSGDKEKVIFTFDNAKMLLLERRQALLEYAQNCVNTKILVCENFDYYFDIRKGLADLENTLHCAQLLIALLNGYVGEEYDDVSEERKKLIREREELFLKIIGVPADTDIGIRIQIGSRILKNGLTLVDLPGLGSDTKSHTRITTNYINRADCCVMLFGMNGKASDTREALELMQDYEIMRFPGKSNRFITAINKCDRSYEEDLYYDEAIEQAARTVYDTLHSVEIHEIIPISARYAEYRYVLNGVPPENTILGRKLARKGSSPEQILEELKKNYNTAFEYTDPSSNTTVSYSTQKFLDETIGEYSTRIRHLNLIRTVSSITEILKETLGGLEMETKMVAMFNTLGSNLMKDLLERIDKAIKETQSDFLNQINEITKDMDTGRVKLASILKDVVIPTYESELSRADKQLNNRMSQEIKKMQPDFFGHYCIDDMDGKSRANKIIFDDLKKYFLNFDFRPFLKPGNELLNDYLIEQRSSYDNGIERLASCFRELPGHTDEALDEAFKEFLESDSLKKEMSENEHSKELADEILNIYNNCFEEAKRAITNHLSVLSKQMNKKIRRDKRVKIETDKTINQVFSFFDDLCSTYHRRCSNYLSSRTNYTFWLARPCLNIEGIRRQISIPFYNEEDRKVYVGKLDIDLNGQEPESHNSRMEAALKTTFISFQEESSKKINNILPIIKNKTETLFGGGKDEIKYRYTHIIEIINLLEKALDISKNDNSIIRILDESYDWSKESADAAKENIDQEYKHIETVRKETEVQLQLVSSGSSTADENAAETEQI